MDSYQNNSGESREISEKETIALLVTVGAAAIAGWVMTNPQKIEELWFKYFVHVYMTGAVLISAFAGFLIYFIKKKTKGLKARSINLTPVMVKKEDEYDESKITVGKTEDGVNIKISDKERTGHVQVIGSTGRGKTESVILPWASRDMMKGRSVIVIDGKGSPDLMERVFENSRMSGANHRVLRFDLNDLKGCGKINPISSGSAQQITDRIFSAFTFEEPFYKSVQSNICRDLISLLQELKEAVNFKSLHELLTDDVKLSEKLKGLSDIRLKNHFIIYLKESKNERAKKVHGLVSQIAPFAVGELSEVVNGDRYMWDQTSIQLSDIVTNGGYRLNTELKDKKDRRPFALVISIPTLKYQDIGHQLGKLILQDIAFAIGQREKNSDTEFLPIFLDEFSEFVYPKFVSALNKARSANVAFHLSHQSMGDLDSVSRDFSKSVITNTNIKCILGLNDPDTADFFARHMGTKTEEKSTEQIDGSTWGEHNKTGRLSLREVETFKISPNDLKNLSHGRGVIHIPSKSGNISEIINFKRFDSPDLDNELYGDRKYMRAL